jgi:hypothetical protein
MCKVYVALLSALLLAVSHSWAADAPSSTTLRYLVLSNGARAGNEVDIYGPDGHIDCTFEFNDRGRGPKIAAHYFIAAGGLPVKTEVAGNDYLKAPVDEHFAVSDGIGRWKSTSENGQARAPGF